MDDKEVIDLTGSDNREVIMVESGDESPSTKHARQTNGVNSKPQKDTSTTTQQEDRTEDCDRRRKRRERRVGRSRRRKRTVVGDEDGEIVELDATEESGKVSREGSKEAPTTGSSEAGPSKSSGSTGGAVVRSLLDRLADPEDLRTLEQENNPSHTHTEDRKKRKKRRHKDRDRTQPESPTNGDDVSSSTLFFVDDAPAEVPTVAQFRPPNVASTTEIANPDQRPEENRSSLLLPAHVSVFEGSGNTPIQIIAPAVIDSEEEDYIEYLDYNDDRKVFTSIPNCCRLLILFCPCRHLDSFDILTTRQMQLKPNKHG